MLLGWESNTSVWQKSAKLEWGKLKIRGGESQVPDPLYETRARVPFVGGGAVKVVHKRRQQVDFGQIVERIENEDPVICGLKLSQKLVKFTTAGAINITQARLSYLHILVGIIVSYLSPALMETYYSCVQVILGEHVQHQV